MDHQLKKRSKSASEITVCSVSLVPLVPVCSVQCAVRVPVTLAGILGGAGCLGTSTLPSSQDHQPTIVRNNADDIPCAADKSQNQSLFQSLVNLLQKKHIGVNFV